MSRVKSGRGAAGKSASIKTVPLVLALVGVSAATVVSPARADWFEIGDESIAEQRLNTFVSNNQDHATVALGSGGLAIAAWHSNVASGLDAMYSILGLDGAHLDLDPPNGGFEDLASLSTSDDQSVPDVVSSRGVDGLDVAIIAWSSGSDVTNAFDTHVNLFDTSGPFSGREHKANGLVPSHRKTYPDVAAVRCDGEYPPCQPDVGNGWFVVVWAQTTGGSSSQVEILSRAYDASGEPLRESVTRLNNEVIDQTTPWAKILPDVAVNHQGDAVAVWEYIDHSTVPPHTVLRYCEFNPFYESPALCSADSEVHPPQTAGEGQIRPSVDLTTSGEIAIAWSEVPMDSIVDSQASSWFWRQTEQNEGEGPFHVDFKTESPEKGHHLVVARFVDDDPDHLVMAWTFDDANGGDILGREVCMTPSGSPDPLGPDEVVLNERTAGDQKRPALDYGYVESLNKTRVWVTWESLDRSGASGVIARYDIRGRAWDPAASGCE